MAPWDEDARAAVSMGWQLGPREIVQCKALATEILWFGMEVEVVDESSGHPVYFWQAIRSPLDHGTLYTVSGSTTWSSPRQPRIGWVPEPLGQSHERRVWSSASPSPSYRLPISSPRWRRMKSVSAATDGFQQRSWDLLGETHPRLFLLDHSAESQDDADVYLAPSRSRIRNQDI